MRRVNVRFLLGTILCVLALAGAVYALHTRQYSQQAATLKRMIDDSDVTDSLFERVDRLRRYTALVPDDATCLEQLGMLLCDAGRYREANLPLASALNLYSARADAAKVVEIRRKLVTTALVTGRLSDAEHQLDNLRIPIAIAPNSEDHEKALAEQVAKIDASERPLQAEYYEQLAACRLTEAKWKEADALLQIAIAFDPSRCSAYARLADLEADEFGGFDSGLKRLDLMIAQNPEDARAYFERGRFRLRHLAKQGRPLPIEGSTRASESSSTEGPSSGPASAAASEALTLDVGREAAIRFSREERELALADANRALGLSDSRDILMLAMECEYQFHKGEIDRNIVTAHLRQAADLAKRVLVTFDDEFNERKQKYEKDLIAQAAAKRHRAEERGLKSSADETSSTLSAAELKSLKSSIFRTASPVYNVLAGVALFENRVADAVSILKEGLERIPSDELLLLNLATLTIVSGNEAQQNALNGLIRTLQDQPGSASLAEYLNGRRLVAEGEIEGGLNTLEIVRDKLSGWPDVMAEADYWIGNCQLQLGEPRRAAKAFQRVLERRPDSVAVLLRLAKALQEVGSPQDLDRAQGIYAELNQRSLGITDSERSAVTIAYVQLMKSQYSGLPAEYDGWTRLLEVVRRLRSQFVQNPEYEVELDLLEADVHLARGLPGMAEQLLSASVERDPQSARLWAALSLVQTLALASGNKIQAVGESAADDAAAGSVDAATEDRAVETLRKAAAAIVDPTADDRTTLQIAKARHCLMLRLQNARPELEQMASEAIAADEIAQKALAETPDSADLRAARAAQLRLIGELGGLTMLIDDVPTSARLYERLRASDPENLAARMILFDLELRRRFDPDLLPEAAKAQHDEQIEKLQNLLKEIQGPGRRDRLAKYGAAIVAVLKANQEPADDKPAREERIKQYAAALQMLGDLQLSLGRVAQRMLYLTGEIHDRIYQLQRIDNQREAKTSFVAATESYLQAFNAGYRTPDSIFKLLRNLHLTGQDNEASRVLLTLGEQAPNLLETVQATTTIADQLGNPSDLVRLAENYARRVVQTRAGESDAIAQVTLGQILMTEGALDESEQVFDRAQLLAADDVRVWQALARGYHRIYAARALQKSQATTDSLRQRFAEMLSVAQAKLNRVDFGRLKVNVLILQGDLDAASAGFEAELSEVPADLRQATADQIRLLADAGEFYLQQAGSTHPEVVAEGEAIFHRLVEDGMSVYCELRDARRERGAHEKISPKEQQLAQVIAEARRLLASRQMAKADSVSLNASLAYIVRNGEDFGLKDVDRRIEAAIRSRMKDRTERRKGITLLESVIAGALYPEQSDLLLVATMYLTEYQNTLPELNIRERAYGPNDLDLKELRATADADLHAAERHLQDVVFSSQFAGSKNGSYSAALVQLIEIELLRGQPREARVYLDRLQVATQGTPAALTPIVEARVLFAEGDRHEEVRELMSQVVDTAPQDRRRAVMASIAQLLEGFGTQLESRMKQPPRIAPEATETNRDDVTLGQSASPNDAIESQKYFAAAETLYRKIAERNADDHLLLAAHFGRRGRTDEALRIISTEIGAAQVDEIASACAEVMKGIGEDPEAMRNLDQVLQISRDQFPDSVALKQLHADVKSWMGDVSGAEVLYREVLAKSPENIVAGNNLAYLLAAQKRQLDEALGLMNSIIDRVGAVPALLDTRAYVRLQRGEHSEALRDLALFIDKEPRPAFLLHEAQSRLAAGMREEAAAAWRRAESAGLTERMVHPLERAAYGETRSQLASSKGVSVGCFGPVLREERIRLLGRKRRQYPRAKCVDSADFSLASTRAISDTSRWFLQTSRHDIALRGRNEESCT